jgi:predicted Rdx family selenoprotein
VTQAVPLKIHYCGSCGYLTRALSLVAAIKAVHGLHATLTPVSGGRYELWSGETLILKRSWLSVPSEEAMLAALRTHLDADHP